MTIWPFFPTFFSASALFSSLSVLPSFHFHSLSLFSGSKWKEGHLNIISLWTYRHISHCNRHHKKPSTSANPQDWLLALVPSRQVLEFSKEHCPAEDADNLSSRALTSIHVALRQYRFCQSRVPFWKGQKSSLDFLSWLLSGLFLSLLGNWTKLQEINFHFDRRNTILAQNAIKKFLLGSHLKTIVSPKQFWNSYYPNPILGLI